MPVEVEATIEALYKIATRVEAATDEVAYKGALWTLRLARVYAPNRRGDLAGSIEITPGRHGVYYVGPTVVYGRIRELGGRIPQKPMSHPFLRWYWKGRPIFKKSVRQRGTHYMRHAWLMAAPGMERQAPEIWGRAIFGK